MREPVESSVRSAAPPIGVAADSAPVADRLPLAATVTDHSGTPVLTITLSVEPAGAAELPTIIAEGDVDVDTAPLLHSVVIAAVDRHPRVCCDLASVTFFSAAGINALVAGRRRAMETGSRLEVRGAHGITRRVLEITGLDILLTDHP